MRKIVMSAMRVVYLNGESEWWGDVRELVVL